MLNKVVVLAKQDFALGLDARDLVELSGKFQWREFEAGVNIITQGEEQRNFYILNFGKVEILYDHQDSTTLHGDKLSPGQSFGELDLFTGNPAFATVRTLEKSQLLTLSATDFANMLIRWPSIYEHFIANFAKKIKQININLWESERKEFVRAGLKTNQTKFYNLWGSVKTTKNVEDKISLCAQTEEPLLIVGEEGTGHQMMAWYIHKAQFGEDATFIVIDGKHLGDQWSDLRITSPDNHTESNRIKGFTLLHLAEKGTLYIRNLNLISPRGQQHLAELMKQKPLPCRIIAGILDPPETLLVPVTPLLLQHFKQVTELKPLRERKKDIPVLINGILEQLARRHNRPTPELEQPALKLLLTHNYRQGNVTELIKIMERAFFLADGNIIGLEHLFFGPAAQTVGRSFDLLQSKTIRNFIAKGYFPNWFKRIFFVIFVLVIALLLVAPSSTLAQWGMLMAWGLWWPILVISSFTLGRIWCSVCPISLGMELAQKYFHLNLPVPGFIKRFDYLIVTLLFLIIFWLEAVTHMRFNPLYTGLWLVIIMVMAAVTGVIFTRHAWCKHLCPLGGLVGMASINGILEIRAETDICLNKCVNHECYRGTPELEGCPMSQYAPYLDCNLDCKLCLRCVRNCRLDAMKFNVRLPAREIWQLVRVNQGYVIFIGVTLFILLPIIYFEPLWGIWPETKWKLHFTLYYWGTALLAGLLVWYLVRPFKTKAASIRVKLAFTLIPLLLAGHTAYQLHFIPGLKSLMLGFYNYSQGRLAPLLEYSALHAGQILAALGGLLVTLLSISRVLWRKK